MKIALLLSLGLFSLSLFAQNGGFVAAFHPVWKRACAYTLECAEAMPDSLYQFRPDSSVLTYGEHLLHICENLYSLNGRFVAGTGFPSDRYTRVDASTLSKAQIMAQLRDAFEYVDSTLLSLQESELQAVVEDFWSPDPTTRATIFLLMRDHMTHHRGALVIYLRLNQITPPRYRGW